jgi:hypothetical protein
VLNKRGISKPPPVFLSSFWFLLFTGTWVNLDRFE